jgi:hypothetical protein
MQGYKSYPKPGGENMTPKVEEYMDTTCVASTGGKMFFEY